MLCHKALCSSGEFEKDSAEYLRHLEPPEEEESQDLHPAESEEEAEGASVLGLGALAPGKSFASLDLRFWQEFIWKLLNSEWQGPRSRPIWSSGFQGPGGSPTSGGAREKEWEMTLGTGELGPGSQAGLACR